MNKKNISDKISSIDQLIKLQDYGRAINNYSESPAAEMIGTLTPEELKLFLEYLMRVSHCFSKITRDTDQQTLYIQLHTVIIDAINGLPNKADFQQYVDFSQHILRKINMEGPVNTNLQTSAITNKLPSARLLDQDELEVVSSLANMPSIILGIMPTSSVKASVGEYSEPHRQVGTSQSLVGYKRPATRAQISELPRKYRYPSEGVGSCLGGSLSTNSFFSQGTMTLPVDTPSINKVKFNGKVRSQTMFLKMCMLLALYYDNTKIITIEDLKSWTKKWKETQAESEQKNMIQSRDAYRKGPQLLYDCKLLGSLFEKEMGKTETVKLTAQGIDSLNKVKTSSGTDEEKFAAWIDSLVPTSSVMHQVEHVIINMQKAWKAYSVLIIQTVPSPSRNASLKI